LETEKGSNKGEGQAFVAVACGLWVVLMGGWHIYNAVYPMG